jgi:DNA-binding NtrC family response regulator
MQLARQCARARERDRARGRPLARPIITSRELVGDHDAAEGEDGEGRADAKGRQLVLQEVRRPVREGPHHEALRDANGSRSKAAEMLGIYRRLLYAKIKEYGLEGTPPKGR